MVDTANTFGERLLNIPDPIRQQAQQQQQQSQQQSGGGLGANIGGGSRDTPPQSEQPISQPPISQPVQNETVVVTRQPTENTFGERLLNIPDPIRQQAQQQQQQQQSQQQSGGGLGGSASPVNVETLKQRRMEYQKGIGGSATPTTSTGGGILPVATASIVKPQDKTPLGQKIRSHIRQRVVDKVTGVDTQKTVKTIGQKELPLVEKIASQSGGVVSKQDIQMSARGEAKPIKLMDEYVKAERDLKKLDVSYMRVEGSPVGSTFKVGGETFTREQVMNMIREDRAEIIMYMGNVDTYIAQGFDELVEKDNGEYTVVMSPQAQRRSALDFTNRQFFLIEQGAKEKSGGNKILGGILKGFGEAGFGAISTFASTGEIIGKPIAKWYYGDKFQDRHYVSLFDVAFEQKGTVPKTPNKWLGGGLFGWMGGTTIGGWSPKGATQILKDKPAFTLGAIGGEALMMLGIGVGASRLSRPVEKVAKYGFDKSGKFIFKGYEKVPKIATRKAFLIESKMGKPQLIDIVDMPVGKTGERLTFQFGSQTGKYTYVAPRKLTYMRFPSADDIIIKSNIYKGGSKFWGGVDDITLKGSLFKKVKNIGYKTPQEVMPQKSVFEFFKIKPTAFKVTPKESSVTGFTGQYFRGSTIAKKLFSKVSVKDKFTGLFIEVAPPKATPTTIFGKMKPFSYGSKGVVAPSGKTATMLTRQMPKTLTKGLPQSIELPVTIGGGTISKTVAGKTTQQFLGKMLLAGGTSKIVDVGGVQSMGIVDIIPDEIKRQVTSKQLTPQRLIQMDIHNTFAKSLMSIPKELKQKVMGVQTPVVIPRSTQQQMVMSRQKTVGLPQVIERPIQSPQGQELIQIPVQTQPIIPPVIPITKQEIQQVVKPPITIKQPLIIEVIQPKQTSMITPRFAPPIQRTVQPTRQTTTTPPPPIIPSVATVRRPPVSFPFVWMRGMSFPSGLGGGPFFDTWGMGKSWKYRIGSPIDVDYIIGV